MVRIWNSKRALRPWHGAPRQQGTESFSLEGGPDLNELPVLSLLLPWNSAQHHPHLLPNIECHTESARDRDLRCNQRRGNGFAAGFAAAGHMPPCACERANWLCEVIGWPVQNTNSLVYVELQPASLTPLCQQVEETLHSYCQFCVLLSTMFVCLFFCFTADGSFLFAA